MNIYIYSDESGVFDYEHNDYFVFAGIILLGADETTKWERKYAAAENAIKKNYAHGYELKATKINNKDKGKLFRSLNHCHKFSVVIHEQNIHKQIYKSKKDKQRYLDYAYKIAVKRALEDLISRNIIKTDEIEGIYFFVDEHTTATNGKYELRESLESELKYGTFNPNWKIYYPPLFPGVKHIDLQYCNSASKRLIRCADIIANKVYYLVSKDEKNELKKIGNLHHIELP